MLSPLYIIIKLNKYSSRRELIMNLFKLFNKETSTEIKEPIVDVKEIENIEVIPQFKEVVEDDIQTIYDNAHKKVMKDMIRKQVKDSIISYVIGADVLKETRNAIYYLNQIQSDNYKKDSNNRMSDEHLLEIVLDKFPNARTKYRGYGMNMEISVSVSMEDLVQKILDDLIK